MPSPRIEPIYDVHSGPACPGNPVVFQLPLHRDPQSEIHGSMDLSSPTSSFAHCQWVHFPSLGHLTVSTLLKPDMRGFSSPQLNTFRAIVRLIVRYTMHGVAYNLLSDVAPDIDTSTARNATYSVTLANLKASRYFGSSDRRPHV